MNNNVGIISSLQMAGTRMVELLKKCTFVFQYRNKAPNSKVLIHSVPKQKKS
jgi:hypothetical protein